MDINGATEPAAEISDAELQRNLVTLRRYVAARRADPRLREHRADVVRRVEAVDRLDLDDA